MEFNYGDATGTCYKTAVYDQAAGSPADVQVVIDVLKNDIACDEQFDVNTLKVVHAPEKGEARPIDGLIFYYPEDNFEGQVQLVYSVATRTNPGHLYYGVVQVSLHPVPPVLVANPDAFNYTTEEFKTILSSSHNEVNYSLQQILGNDVLGDLQYNELQISIVTQPRYGIMDYQQLERFLYMPGDDFSGADSFTYRIMLQWPVR